MKEFEDLIDEIGGQGYYQKRLLYIVLGPLFFFLPLSWLNEIFLLHTPTHWCYHPYLDGLNETQLEEWKTCFLPLEQSAEGGLAPASCKIAIPEIYNSDEDSFWNDTDLTLFYQSGGSQCPTQLSNGSKSGLDNGLSTVSCRLGWKFDQSEFIATVVTDQNWVCNDAEYVPQLYTYGVVGSILGTIIFSYLGDLLGRRFIFWITTAIVIVFMAAKTYLDHVFVAYLIFKLIAASAYCASYQLPFTLITEITDADYRSWAIGITCVTWTAGLCFLPLIGWLSGEWRVISLATVLPMLTVFLGWNYVPESPRWQLTKGLRDKAAKTIRHMARLNKKPEPKDLENRLDHMIELMREEESKNLGYISLFSSRGMTIKTINVTIALVASNFIYYQLMLNVDNMSGSTFLNFFLLSVIEGPAYFLGVWLSDFVGRRWSHTCLLALNTICLFINCFIANIPSYSTGVIICCLISKFISSATFLIVYVQTVELYPTNIRNTGMGFTSLLGMVIGIAGPYVIHLGTIDVRYPYGIMAFITLCGTIAASFLPETIGAALPETIPEAAEFGRNQKFFSWIRESQKPLPAKNQVEPM